MLGVGSAVSAFQKMQMDMIGKLSVGSEKVLEEVPFWDEGYIHTQIERLKREHEDVSRDLKIAVELNLQSDNEQQKKAQLKARLDGIEEKMFTYAINSFQSLPLCKALAKGKSGEFTILVQALECYHAGEKAQAELCFQKYFEDSEVESASFLGNKIYGKLLLKKGKVSEALRHLECAVQRKVDDLELLLLLQHAYEEAGMQMERDVVAEVYRLIG